MFQEAPVDQSATINDLLRLIKGYCHTKSSTKERKRIQKEIKNICEKITKKDLKNNPNFMKRIREIQTNSGGAFRALVCSLDDTLETNPNPLKFLDKQHICISIEYSRSTKASEQKSPAARVQQNSVIPALAQHGTFNTRQPQSATPDDPTAAPVQSDEAKQPLDSRIPPPESVQMQHQHQHQLPSATIYLSPTGEIMKLSNGFWKDTKNNTLFYVYDNYTLMWNETCTYEWNGFLWTQLSEKIPMSLPQLYNTIDKIISTFFERYTVQPQVPDLAVSIPQQTIPIAPPDEVGLRRKF